MACILSHSRSALYLLDDIESNAPVNIPNGFHAQTSAPSISDDIYIRDIIFLCTLEEAGNKWIGTGRVRKVAKQAGYAGYFADFPFRPSTISIVLVDVS